MHTGDLGVMRTRLLQTRGRVKDMIIRGARIFAAGNRGVPISTSGGVDVAVVGVPDPKFGEAVCACVRTARGHDATRRRSGSFAARDWHYKVPAMCGSSTAFPLTISGKVQKS